MATQKIQAGNYEAYIPGHGWVHLAADVRTAREAQRVARSLHATEVRKAGK